MTLGGIERPYDRPKRLLDVIGASLALVMLSPVIAAVGILVAVKLGRPVLFQQERPGKDGEIFKLRKFRSMIKADESRGLVSDEARLTPFGRALRATSLDELPTLVNVLTGDMSIVGPRPLLVRYLSRYSPAQARRHGVRPGITGLAQASGRNALGWEDKFALDVEYVEHRSLWLDLRILSMTVRSVVRRQGISADGHSTAPEFLGSAGSQE